MVLWFINVRFVKKGNVLGLGDILFNLFIPSPVSIFMFVSIWTRYWETITT